MSNMLARNTLILVFTMFVKFIHLDKLTFNTFLPPSKLLTFSRNPSDLRNMRKLSNFSNSSFSLSWNHPASVRKISPLFVPVANLLFSFSRVTNALYSSSFKHFIIFIFCFTLLLPYIAQKHGDCLDSQKEDGMLEYTLGYSPMHT